MTLLTLTQWIDRTWSWPSVPVHHRFAEVPVGYNKIKSPVWLKTTLLSVFMVFFHEIMNYLWKVLTYCHQYGYFGWGTVPVFWHGYTGSVLVLIPPFFFWKGGGGGGNVYDLSPVECGFYRRVYETSRGIFDGSFVHTLVILMLWKTRRLRTIVWRSL